MTITEFDSIFTYIGGFGRYQTVLFCTNCLVCMNLAFMYCSQFFMTLTPPHWCAPPPDLLDLNLTQAQVKDLTIPIDQVTGKYLECHRYDVDFQQVVITNVSWPDPTWPNTTCDHGWIYDYTIYYPTITSELDWVCEEDWKPTFSQSLFYVGSFVASPVLGWAADRWGRLPVIVFTNMVAGVAGIASAFCTSFTTFTIFRFITGMMFDTHFTVMYILLLEYVSSQYRTMMANVPLMFFLTAGLCSMPWLAVGVAHWSTFTVLVHAPLLLSIFFIWLVPESARWLLSQGRVDDTINIIQKVAKTNRKTLSPEILQEFKAYGTKQAEAQPAKTSVFNLCKTPKLRLRFIILIVMWMVITVAYDGHMRNTEHLSSNVFVTFTILGFVELPADFLTMVLVEKFGRRHTTVWSLILSGGACFIIAALPPDSTMTIMWMAVAGRFLITMAINVGQQYPVEVLPTVARGSGSGAIHTCGYLAGFLTPYVVYLSKYGHYMPYLIMGAATVGGGAVCVLLPETLNQSLPDTLEDGETYFSNQGYCYNPCGRASTEDEELTTKAKKPSASEAKENCSYDNGLSPNILEFEMTTGDD